MKTTFALVSVVKKYAEAFARRSPLTIFLIVLSSFEALRADELPNSATVGERIVFMNTPDRTTAAVGGVQYGGDGDGLRSAARLLSSDTGAKVTGLSGVRSKSANAKADRNAIERSHASESRNEAGLATTRLLPFSHEQNPVALNAENGIWNFNPTDNQWTNGANWVAGIAPNGSGATATFGLSNTTSINIGEEIEVGGIGFNAGASAFTITVASGNALFLTGDGIINNTGIIQTFETAINPQRVDDTTIVFSGNASAGVNTAFINNAASVAGAFGSSTAFVNGATGGNGIFTNRGAAIAGAGAGNTAIVYGSSGSDGTFVNQGGTDSGAQGGFVYFDSTEFFTATAGNGTFVNHAGTVAGAGGGRTQLFNSSTAGSGLFISNGAAMADADSGVTIFSGTSSAGNATLIANGGTGGGAGGSIVFLANSTGDTASVLIAGNGSLNIGPHQAPGVTIGSLETTAGNSIGGGSVILGSRTLQVGANDESTEFSGVISDGGPGFGAGGSLTKVGLGTLTLSGANSYTGGTTVSQGILRVTESSGSGLGTGPVTINPNGRLTFSQSSRGGSNTLTVFQSPGAGIRGGELLFEDFASAGSLRVTQNGGSSAAVLSSAATYFLDNSTAGNAEFENFGADAAMAPAGAVIFYAQARAGNATLTNHGANSANGGAGQTLFYNTSSADAATITNRGKTIAMGTSGGITLFFNDSRAGTATIINEGSDFAPSPSPAGGWTKFLNGASAEQATIINRGPIISGGGRGETLFNGDIVGKVVTADRATITNEGGLFPFQAGGATLFQGTATAGAATFTNNGALAADAYGGSIYFNGTANGGTAFFTNKGGVTERADGGFLGFFDTTTAAQSTILNEGGNVAGAQGGIAYFSGSSTAGQATLHGLPGVGSAFGGRFVFDGLSEGGTARIILDGSGSEAAQLIVQVSDDRMGIGSIEGSGTVALGGAELIVGKNNLSTEFSGLIRDGLALGGTLTKVGTGTLIISGVQDYTTLNANGGTTIVETPLGSGSSNVNVSAQAIFTTDQTLLSLIIGDGGLVTLTSAAPAPNSAASDDPFASGLAVETFVLPDSDQSIAAHVPAVPEPGILHLLMAALLLGCRRSRQR